MKHTLVIVGAGLAGLSAALTAVKNGWTVKLVSSLASERAQSVMAEGGINAALNTKGEEDSPEQHYTDTLTAACGLADPNAVWGMTQAASELVRSLHHLGVQFNVTDDDELDLRNFGGQKKKRTAFAQSDTGKQLMTALIDAVRREESAGTVERFPHHKFRTLLLSGNICGGCTVQDTYTGELLRFVCDAVLIATGGLHGLFGDTTGSLANTGEVTAELFRLGVPMANLEMIQYHPTTVELGEKRMLLSEAARGEGGRLFALRNGKPWYFMEEKYPELGNLMPRDITAREVWTVSRDYEVFLDMTELPKEVMEHKLAGLVDDCQTYLQKDIRKEPIPILPGIHYFMGGIQVDERHRTSMRNLYAAGECCAQYHGANRLGGNSLLGAIYGGQIAAETACRETVSSPNMPCAEESLLPELSPDAQMQMNRILLNALGVVRDAQTLEAGIQEIRKPSGWKFSSGCDLWRTDCCGNCLPGNSQFPQYALCRRIPSARTFPGRSNADESYPAERTRCRAGCTDIGSGHSGNPQTVWHPSASGLCHAGKCPRPKRKPGCALAGRLSPTQRCRLLQNHRGTLERAAYRHQL